MEAAVNGLDGEGGELFVDAKCGRRFEGSLPESNLEAAGGGCI